MRMLLAVLVSLTATACALRVAGGADYSPTIDFGRYSSFEWDEPDTRPMGDPRLENNELFERRLHAAIAVELADAGIRQATTGPRLVVHHHATVRNRVDVYEADVEEGYGSEFGAGTQVVQYEEGTSLVDIADAETRDLVWRGWALSDPDVMAHAIDEAIGAMFRDFPPGT